MKDMLSFPQNAHINENNHDDQLSSHKISNVHGERRLFGSK
jgi:hypothetical protein